MNTNLPRLKVASIYVKHLNWAQFWKRAMMVFKNWWLFYLWRKIFG